MYTCNKIINSNSVFIGRTKMVNQLQKYGAKDDKSKSEDAELEKFFEKLKGRKFPKFLRRKH